ncbi:hypothetical protein CH64_1839 [Yersinia rohdei]|uniref:Uncharacterized protein n=1 Tax=Yersinia rohdei TaxID=29485 RepID=A0ABM5S7X2_YERRO|nr:hypothetical protein [Yersinia rohdei]AJJ09289.1 hypothetical protein CH64_1839 [Yersinia rohdei]CQJ50259.1 Uncharacterised protein [Yersinia rohdei]
MLLSVLYGTEALTVLKDSFDLERSEVIDLTVWGEIDVAPDVYVQFRLLVA